MTDVSLQDDVALLTDAPLDDKKVAEYLLSHLDFFGLHPDLLTQLRIPHNERGTVSLVELQLERLRNRVQELEGNIGNLVSLATKNSELFSVFSQAQQKLFQTHNIYQALIILDDLSNQLGLEFSLRLFDSLDEQIFLERRLFDNFRKSRLVARPVYLGRLRKTEAELLFEQPPQLGSFVVLPLGVDRLIGVLSFSSPDGGHFQPEMDTMFVEQLASVLTRLIHHWEYSREVID
jgi:uncharacterized protein YigA (DUF484 family)